MNFRTADGARGAVEALNGHCCGGRSITARLADRYCEAWDRRPSERIHVSGLREATTADELHRWFAGYGSVKRVQMLPIRGHQKAASAIVTMAHSWQAAQAIGLHTNRELRGHSSVPLVVKFAYTRVSIPPRSRTATAHRVVPTLLIFKRLYHQRPDLVVPLLLAFAYAAGHVSSGVAVSLASLLITRLRRAVVRLLHTAPGLTP